MSAIPVRLLFVLAMMAIASPVVAQTGTIAGKVTGVTGTPISGVQVRASTGTRTVGSALTDANGDYRMAEVPAGTDTANVPIPTAAPPPDAAAGSSGASAAASSAPAGAPADPNDQNAVDDVW